MSYEVKYLKYKNKYLKLKNSFQKGGGPVWNYDTVELNTFYELLHFREVNSRNPPDIVYVIKKERENPTKNSWGRPQYYNEKYTIIHVNTGSEEIIENDMRNLRTGGIKWKFCKVHSNLLSPMKDFDLIEIGKKYKLIPSKYNKFETKNITILEKLKETKEGIEYSGPIIGNQPITSTVFTYKIIDELGTENEIFCNDRTKCFSFLEIPQ